MSILFLQLQAQTLPNAMQFCRRPWAYNGYHDRNLLGALRNIVIFERVQVEYIKHLFSVALKTLF